MARSKDPRHPLPAERGPKRTGPIGSILPGDDVEVARDIQRLWWELQLLRRRLNECCGRCDCGDGDGGGAGGDVSGWDDGNLLWWYRLGDSFDLTGGGDDVFADSSGNSRPLDYLEASSAPDWDTDNRPTLHVDPLFDVSDGHAITFNYPPTAASGTPQGGAWARASNADYYNFGADLRTVAVLFRPTAEFTGDGYGYGLIFGNYQAHGGSVDGSPPDVGWGVFFRHDDGTLRVIIDNVETNLGALTPGDQYLFVMAFDPDAGEYSFYIGADLQDTYSGAGTDSNSYDFRLGGGVQNNASGAVPCDFFCGTVEEAAGWSVIKTSDDVAAFVAALSPS